MYRLILQAVCKFTHFKKLYDLSCRKLLLQVKVLSRALILWGGVMVGMGPVGIAHNLLEGVNFEPSESGAGL